MSHKHEVQTVIHDVLAPFGMQGANLATIKAKLNAQGGRQYTNEALQNALNRGTMAGTFRIVGDRGAKKRTWRNRDQRRPRQERQSMVVGSGVRLRAIDEWPERTYHDPGPPCVVQRRQANGFIVSINCSSLDAARVEIAINGGTIVTG